MKAAPCLALVFLTTVPLLQAAPEHSATVDTADFQAQVEDGWLTAWTNKRTGETFAFGRPSESPTPTCQPGLG